MQAEYACQTPPNVEACVGTQDHAFLPEEILGLIFEYLSLLDRKAVRLTCRAWSNASKSISIIKNEKLVFRPQYPNIISTLSASNLVQLNLEFQGRRIDKFPVSLWRKCGSRIRNLKFYACRLSPEVLGNIIVRCNNLMSLDIINPWKSERRDNCNALIRALNHCIELGITRANLNVLKVEETAVVSVLVTDLLQKAILVFPGIKYFKVCLLSDLEDSGIGEEVSLNYISQLKSFAYHNMYLRFSFVLDKSIQMSSSLVEFQTYLPKPKSKNTTQSEKTLLKFFSTQGNLRIVKLEVEEATLLKKLVFFVLQNCKKLRELTIGGGSTVELSSSEATQFLDSITTLEKLEFDDCSLELPLTFISYPRKLALRSLDFHNSYEADTFFFIMLAGCEKMEHLSCKLPSDYMLELIFENLTNLRSLSLMLCARTCKFGFIDQNEAENEYHCIQHLKNLESLVIGGGQIKYLPSNGLEFPKLKHLQLIALTLQNSFDELCAVVWSMPMLQSLAVHCTSYRVDMDDVFALCQPLKNLQCLSFSKADICIDDRELFLLFHEYCPSLRYVITEEEVFLYNPFVSKISACSIEKFDHPLFVKKDHWNIYCT